MAESIAPAHSNAPPDPVGARRRCDALCDEFEQAWQRGERPSVAAFAARVPAQERAKLLRELVALDCAYRREAAEAAEKADDPFAAAFHWNWLRLLEPAGSNAEAKYDAALEKLKERNLPVPRS